MIGKTWVSGKWISHERGLRNNRHNRRWLVLIDWMEKSGYAHGDQQTIEDDAWKVLRLIEGTR